LGQCGAEHALLGAVVEQPDSGGVVLTGRLALNTQPWLADHVVAGVVLFPGAGFVELAIRAGDEVGCAVVQELVLSVPLVVPVSGGVQIQVVVGAGGEGGRRAVSVYSRAAQPDSEWTLHAEGVLGVSPVHPAADLSVWPPLDATAVDVSDAYQQLAQRGYHYGPAFQGLRALWRRGDEIFADVALPEDTGLHAGGFGIHPALLDAALHGAGVGLEATHTALPFCWQGVSLHAAGATGIRAHIIPTDQDTLSIELADTSGQPVLSVGALTTRVVSTEQLHAALSASTKTHQGLLEVVWTPISLDDTTTDEVTVLSWNDFHTTDTDTGSDVGGAGNVVVWELQSVGAGVVGSVYAATHRGLQVLQSW
ncbi:MAG: polyketide synthase dehydratase domain-containing protein, partial [Mycobacterium sp.]